MPEPAPDSSHISNLFKLDGKVALIIGGSRGLGASMALGLAQAGAATILCSRSQSDCDAGASAVHESTGMRSIGMAADATREDEIKRLFANVMDEFHQIDILINCAGINFRQTIENVPFEEFRRVMEVNVNATWLACHEIAPILKAQRSGSVINVGSALSEAALPERGAYCLSKAGLLGLTRVLALEWAPFNARCNILCPGPFLTEMNQPLLDNPAKAQLVVGQTAMNRWGEMHEIRGAALFLASAASSFVTGAALYVDGGWTAK